MTELKTETFSLQIPPELDQHRVTWETIRAESSQIEYEMQNPELNAGLGEQSDYDENSGDSFFERFCQNTTKRYEDATIVETLELDVQGQSSIVQISQLSWDWDGKQAQVYYLNAALPVDDQYHYEMKAYCEQPQWETFRPLFLDTWQSLKHFGDREEALRKQQEAIDALYNRHSPPEPTKPEIKPFQVPATGRSFLRVGQYHLTLSEDTKSEIPDFDHNLNVTLKADVPTEFRGDDTIFDEYDVQNGVGFRIRFSGIHKQGVPTGHFIFEHGRSENHDTYLWDDGWEYSLNFCGEVELRDGWLGMNGYLGKQWDPEVKIELELYYKLDVESLDWSEYRFGSLEELDQVATETVRYLSLNRPNLLNFPERIIELTELRELRISNSTNYFPEPQKLPLGAVPEAISNLKNLCELHISSADLTELPESLGSLTNLEHLSIGHCLLTTTPESIWRLPKLKYLYLSNNELKEIPSKIALPALTNLNLTKNQLQSLPQELAEQPNLQRLELTDNPLKSLPQLFNQVPEIELPMEDKLRLLDFTYEGADGEGCADWNEEAYFAQSNPEFQSRLVETKHGEALAQVAKLSLLLEHDEADDYSEIGNTRFGGYPDLPSTIPYPRFGQNEMQGKTDYVFEFLAQLNCRELAPFQEYLPRTGMLYFFLDTVHEMTPKVIYWDGPETELVSGKTISFEEEDFYEFSDPPYAAYKSTAKAEISLPFSYASYVNTHLFEGAASIFAEDEDLLEELETELGLENRQDYHQVNSHVFTQHECPELQAALQKKGQPQDWVVLLKVASIGDFQWWDAGELFFVIHKSDLQKRDFSNIYCSLESS